MTKTPRQAGKQASRQAGKQASRQAGKQAVACDIREKRDKVSVFLVDDHPIVLEWGRTYLTSHSIAVVGDAASAEEALRRVKKLAPDVIVLGVNLPSFDVGELVRRLRRLVPKIKFIAFGIRSSDAYVSRMARCGVQGYVTKSQPVTELLAAIKDVAGGHPHFPAGMPANPLRPMPKASRTSQRKPRA